MDERKKILQDMKICRFCFNEDEKELTSIYQKEAKCVPLPIQIMSCISIEVFATDGLPQLICKKCKNQTKDSYIFKSNCRKSDDALKNFLQTGQLIKPEIEKTFLKHQKNPPAKISPVKDVKIEAKTSFSDDPKNVKRQKLDDGTEIITLCISNSDDGQNQDETSQDSEQQQQAGNSSLESDEEMLEEEEHHLSTEKVEKLKTGVFPCNLCDKAFPLEQLLEIHITNYHRERPFACDICDMTFFTKYDKAKHQQTHNDIKPYTCTICMKEFSRLTLLRKHELTHTGTSKYMCTECDKSFYTTEDLDNHMKKHDKSKAFTCEECGRTFVFKQGLDRHMDSAHSTDKPYKCTYCEADFSTSIRLKRHITEHAGLRPYRCKVCHRSFLLSHHLTRHLRSHFEKEPGDSIGRHKCDICSMSFRRKDSLINHSAIHSMVNLRCVICNTKFANAKLVKEHITTHLQGLPYPCEKCDYSFDTHKQLVEHEVKHAEIEYEEQVEKEVIDENHGFCNKVENEDEDVSFLVDEDEHEQSEQYEDNPDVIYFHIPNVHDPEAEIEVQPNSNSASKGAIKQPKIKQQEDDQLYAEQTEGLSHIFKNNEENLLNEENRDDHLEEIEDKGEEHDIKPIYRMEGTKMYERKGPIKRKIPEVQNMKNIETVELDEIDEPPSIDAVPTIPADALNNLPTKKPINYKVGDKVLKIQKFIISKDEMKQMAKMGILEVRNGQVIMKSPGQPILNAKIKPIQKSDIENLLKETKSPIKSPVKQYRRATSASTDNLGETSTHE